MIRFFNKIILDFGQSLLGLDHMRQVPAKQKPHYLFIGNGRVSQHFQHYFSYLQLSFDVWHHQQSLLYLNELMACCSHVLLLIPDAAIEPFIRAHLMHPECIRVHFSGSLNTDYAYGVHPLMTFMTTFYELKTYKSIPFVIDHDAPAFSILMPGLSNTYVRIDRKLKAKYHALCVLSGNFSAMLWQKFLSTLETEFNLSASIAHPYLKQQMLNLLHDYQTALTGPLVRQDEMTLSKNLASLANDPFQMVYQSFMDCYAQLMKEKL